jgi:hypothetical protein
LVVGGHGGRLSVLLAVGGRAVKSNLRVRVGGDAGGLSWLVVTVAVGGEKRAQLQVQASCK